MTNHSNTNRDYQQDEQQRQFQFYLNSAQPHLGQNPTSQYLDTNHDQAFTEPAGDSQAQDTNVSMQDLPHQGCWATPAEGYNDSWLAEQNYRAASVGTTTASIVYVNTPSVTTDGGHSNYVMVPTHVPSHRRAYSENSNGTSGQESDSPLFSTPGDQEPWTHGSEYAVDTEAMEVDARSSMPHVQKDVLAGGLYSHEPRTVYDPYQAYDLVSGPTPVNSQETMEYYYVSASQPQSYVLPSRPAKVQMTFEDPWNPMDQRMPAYPTGFVAFAPSPGPNVEPYDNCGSASVPPSPEISKSSQSPEKRTHSGRTSSSAKGKEKDLSPGWEHIVIAKDGLRRVSENPEEEARRRSGVRTGGLAPQAKEKARRIRQVGACWSCWIQKVPCSEGKRCERCENQSRKLSTHQPCWRSGFKEYEPIFFPAFMHAHLRKNKIEDLISEHTTCFLDTVLIVEVSTGQMFKPMKVQTNAFNPKGCDLLRHASLTPAEPDKASQLVVRPSAPVGILGLSLSEMRKKCDKHITDMISNTQYAAQTTAGDISQLPNQILEIMCDYSNAKDVPLLRNALKLHAIHYFMGSLITFSERSVHDIYSTLSPSSPIPDSYLSSRLLNRQIKYVMHKLHREITTSVLEDLERSLRSRTKDSWGPSFCAILILCLCIEGLQSAADMMVVCDLKEKGEKGEEPLYTRDQSYNACEELDEYPFEQCKKLFHDIYKSHKDGNVGGRGDKAFNPLKMAVEGGRMGFDSKTERMVRAVYEIVHGSWTEILELSKRPTIFGFGYPVDPKDIKANNTGRLAAKFLRSFFPDP